MSSLDRSVFRFFNLDIALRYLPRILKGMLVTLGRGLAVLRALRIPFTAWLVIAKAWPAVWRSRSPRPTARACCAAR